VISHVAVNGPTVFIERLDRHHYPEGWAELPVVGVLEMHDGLINSWRDYFDLATLQQNLARGRPVAGLTSGGHLFSLNAPMTAWRGRRSSKNRPSERVERGAVASHRACPVAVRGSAASAPRDKRGAEAPGAGPSQIPFGT
jgi:hypothetical protein